MMDGGMVMAYESYMDQDHGCFRLFQRVEASHAPTGLEPLSTIFR